MKLFKWFVAGLVLINVVIIAVVFLGRSSQPGVELPNPNGHDDFVAAAQKLTADVGVADDLNEAAAARIVSANREALDLIHRGLGRESRLPIRYSMEAMAKEVERLSDMKKLARLLLVEARLAELRGNTNEAAKIGVDTIQFGQESVRGGLLIHALVGVAVEQIALKRMAGWVPAVEPQAAADLAKRIEGMQAKRESSARIIANEKEWSRRVGGVRWALLRVIYLVKGDPMAAAVSGYQAKEQGIRSQVDALAVELRKRGGGKE